MEQMSLISKKKGERIDKFLGENLDDLSRSYIQKLLKDGLILVNGKKVKANYKLNEGCGSAGSGTAGYCSRKYSAGYSV